jgi:hypothetical protein
MEPTSGCFGTVKEGGNDLDEVTYWTLNRTTATDAFGSNQSNCHKKRVAGTKDFTGSFRAKAIGGAVAVTNGASTTIELHVDDTGYNYYSCPVIIQGIGNYEVDIDDGKAISYEVTFEANGALTPNGTVS